MIQAIQADSGEAGQAIASIVTGIEQVNERQADISATVQTQEQSARQIAVIVDEVGDSIKGVVSATAVAREAASSLSDKAGELDRLVATVDS